MSHTYTKIWFHFVFGTKTRQHVIRAEWRRRLHDYLGGTIKGLNGLALAVNGVADHVHLLVSLRQDQRIDYVMRTLKAESSGWIHKEGLAKDFAWQRGYGAFSVSASQVNKVQRYIADQEAHHRKMNFQEEFRKMLSAHDVIFDERFLSG